MAEGLYGNFSKYAQRSEAYDLNDIRARTIYPDLKTECRRF